MRRRNRKMGKWEMGKWKMENGEIENLTASERPVSVLWGKK